MAKFIAKIKGLSYWGPKNQGQPFNNPLYDVVSYIEFSLFKSLLKRYCAKDLDQWERWELKTKYGPVYIQIDRQGDGYNYEELK